MDGREIAIKSIDLINRYFYRSKYKPWLPKQINPRNPFPVLNKITWVNSSVFLQILLCSLLLSIVVFKSGGLKSGPM